MIDRTRTGLDCGHNAAPRLFGLDHHDHQTERHAGIEPAGAWMATTCPTLGPMPRDRGGENRTPEGSVPDRVTYHLPTPRKRFVGDSNPSQSADNGPATPSRHEAEMGRPGADPGSLGFQASAMTAPAHVPKQRTGSAPFAHVDSWEHAAQAVDESNARPPGWSRLGHHDLRPTLIRQESNLRMPYEGLPVNSRAL